MTRLARSRTACTPPSIDEQRCLSHAGERCHASRAKVGEAQAAATVTPDPSRQPPEFEFDVFYIHEHVQCHLAIRTGPGTHLSLMFVTRATPYERREMPEGVSHVTRVALRPELSERPENLANQILRTLFADGDPLRHAPQRGERSRIFADLMRWAARYQAFRAAATSMHETNALPPPAAAQ